MAIDTGVVCDEWEICGLFRNFRPLHGLPASYRYRAALAAKFNRYNKMTSNFYRDANRNTNKNNYIITEEDGLQDEQEQGYDYRNNSNINL